MSDAPAEQREFTDDNLSDAAAHARPTGWGELSRTFDWVAHRYRGGTVTQEYKAIVEAADIAYTSSSNTGVWPSMAAPNAPGRSASLRSTSGRTGGGASSIATVTPLRSTRAHPPPAKVSHDKIG